MKIVLGPNVKMSQGRWAYNTWACDDAYDASKKAPGLIVEAHGYNVNGRWVMDLGDGDTDVENYVRRCRHRFVFLDVCNPGGHDIEPRPGQTVVYQKMIVKGPGNLGRWFRREK